VSHSVHTSTEGVVERWISGNRGMARSLVTDGRMIWSYMIPLASRKPDGRIIILLTRRWSPTTSKHLKLVLAAAMVEGTRTQPNGRLGGVDC